MSYASGALRQYGQIGVQSAVEAASPHRLIQMLMAGGLARIAAARGCIERGDVTAKGETIGLALSIVGCLRSSLDHDVGGEIASNLDALYEYMERRLLEANLKNDAGMLDEVHGLLKEVKAGWDGIEGDAGVGAASVADRLERVAP